MANRLVYANFSVFVLALPLYAAHRFDASAGRIGALLLSINVVNLAAAIPAGRTVRRWGAGRALTAGFVSAAAGMALVLAGPNTAWLLGPLVLYSAGQVLASTAAGDLLLQLGGRGSHAVGGVRQSSDVGLVLGPAAIGALADAAGYAAPFVALSALTALAALASGRGRRTAD